MEQQKIDTTVPVKTSKGDLKEFLASDESFKKAVAQALPKHLTVERFLRVAITTMTRIPKLADCTRESFLRCLLDLSAMGLEPDGRRAHLIPYGKECTLVVDYKGLAELALRSGQIDSLHSDIVCENDEFEYDKGVIVKHKIDLKKERGEPYAAYATAKMKGNDAVMSVVLGKEEIESVRKRSKAGNVGPWVHPQDKFEMWKKTAFRRLSKWLPLSPEFRDAVEKDDDGIIDATDFSVKNAAGAVMED